MKPMVLVPILACVFIASSCRTRLPVDPNTMKPSTRCLPGNIHQHDGTVLATK